jgi:hypothetical protein
MSRLALLWANVSHDRSSAGRAVVPLVSPAVLLAGAGMYALLEGPVGTTFFITPLAVGMVALSAGLAGTGKHLIPAGLGLVGWGAAVLLVFDKVVPAARTTPAYMIGLATGILVAGLVAPADRRGSWSTSAAAAGAGAAVYFFVEYDIAALGRWPAAAISMVAWAIWVTVRAVAPVGYRPREAVSDG